MLMVWCKEMMLFLPSGNQICYDLDLQTPTGCSCFNTRISDVALVLGMWYDTHFLGWQILIHHGILISLTWTKYSHTKMPCLYLHNMLYSVVDCLYLLFFLCFFFFNLHTQKNSWNTHKYIYTFLCNIVVKSIEQFTYKSYVITIS